MLENQEVKKSLKTNNIVKQEVDILAYYTSLTPGKPGSKISRKTSNYKTRKSFYKGITRKTNQAVSQTCSRAAIMPRRPESKARPEPQQERQVLKRWQGQLTMESGSYGARQTVNQAVSQPESNCIHTFPSSQSICLRTFKHYLQTRLCSATTLGMLLLFTITWVNKTYDNHETGLWIAPSMR